jgi:HAD superfamily phosphatase (TIGR01668 family)
MGLLRLLAPDQYVGCVADINLDRLVSAGIRGLLLDVDNTLTAWHSTEIDDGIVEWLEKAKQHFACCIVSNSTKLRRMAELKQRLGVEALAPAGKPWGWAFRRGMRVTKTRPEATAVVGDQLFTDVAGGNRAGCYTILVGRVGPAEFISTRMMRPAERAVIRLIKRRGMWPAEDCS